MSDRRQTAVSAAHTSLWQATDSCVYSHTISRVVAITPKTASLHNM